MSDDEGSVVVEHGSDADDAVGVILESPAHACARETRTRAQVDAIVEGMARLMVTGQWRRGRSTRDAADQHGVSLSTAKHWARLASERAYSGDDDEIQEAKAAHLGQLEVIAGDAHQAGEFDAATKAIRTQHEILGSIRQGGTQVNILQDPRTGALRAEVAKPMSEAVDAVLDAAKRAALACGVDAAAYDDALAREMGGAMVVGGGG